MAETKAETKTATTAPGGAVVCDCGKPNCEHLKANSDRFLGLAEVYDSSRPSIPPCVCDVITSYLSRKPRVIVDLGCGTGLSTRP